MADAPIRIGTRGSKLARAQSATVRDALAAAHPDLGFETVVVETTGDRDQATPLAGMGGVGVFAAELRHALLAGTVDLAVHSLKDLPTDPVLGLALAAITARAAAGDVAVVRDGIPLGELPEGARIGTSSPRRRAWLQHRYAHLEAAELRGNVPTRLQAVADGKVDGVLLAAAGLQRLGRLDEATERFDPLAVPGAPGQGAVAVETRAGCATEALVLPLHHPETAACVEAERRCLAELGGGCALPLGAFACIEGDQLQLVAAMGGGPEGWVRVQVQGAAADPETAGREAAAQLRARGAAGS